MSLTNAVVEGRIVYCHLAEPDKFGKFTCQIIIDKKDPMVAKISAEMKRLIKESLGGKKPAANKIPLGDAEEKFGEDFADSVVLKCTSTEAVRMLAKDKSPLEGNKAFPNGTDVKALVAFSSYTNEFGPGILCFINGVQYISANDPIGRAKPSDEVIDGFFDSIDGGSDADQTEVATDDFFTK